MKHHLWLTLAKLASMCDRSNYEQLAVFSDTSLPLHICLGKAHKKVDIDLPSLICERWRKRLWFRAHWFRTISNWKGNASAHWFFSPYMIDTEKWIWHSFVSQKGISECSYPKLMAPFMRLVNYLKFPDFKKMFSLQLITLFPSHMQVYESCRWWVTPSHSPEQWRIKLLLNEHSYAAWLGDFSRFSFCSRLKVWESRVLSSTCLFHRPSH